MSPASALWRNWSRRSTTAASLGQRARVAVGAGRTGRLRRRAKPLQPRRAALPGGGRSHRETSPELPVAALLEVDAVCREKPEARSLRRITSRRFNPNHERWLHVMPVGRPRLGLHGRVLQHHPGPRTGLHRRLYGSLFHPGPRRAPVHRCKRPAWNPGRPLCVEQPRSGTPIGTVTL